MNLLSPQFKAVQFMLGNCVGALALLWPWANQGLGILAGTSLLLTAKCQGIFELFFVRPKGSN